MRKKVLLMSLMALGPTVMHVHASLSTKEAGMVWTKTAFSPTNSANTVFSIPSLFLGADKPAAPTDPLNALVLARSYLGVDAGSTVVTIDPLAPAKVTLNGAATQVANPINGKAITNLALGSSVFPVVTVEDLNIYLVTSPDDGSTMLNNTDPINDASGTAIDKPVVALTTAFVTVPPATTPSDNLIVAAVAAAGSTGWNDPMAAGDNRGIALLKVNTTNNGLASLDATNIPVAGNKAALLSVVPTPDAQVYPAIGGPVAFVDAGAKTPITKTVIGSNNVDMFFDSKLQRLYVGLTDVGRDATELANEGGMLGVVVGTVNDTGDKLLLLPVIDGVAKALFYDVGTPNVNDRVVGFYVDGDAGAGGQDPFSVTINQINTMHTSTGKDYLVVNSDIIGQAGASEAGIFALPLIGTKLADGTTATPIQQVGTLSKVMRSNPMDGLPTFDGPPTAFDEMPIATDLATQVKFPDLTKTALQDIFVEGDTVYMCTAPTAIAAGDESSINSGIFASTAIFAQDGSIRAWTPVQRVDGSIDAVFGGGLDTLSNQPGDFYMLTSESLTAADLAKQDTVKITQWGTSEDATMQVNNLSGVLATLFPLEKGGLLGLYSFDEQTPGFLTNKFAMMVAVGKDKVALIQTASFDPVAMQFTLTQDFIVGTNVFVRDATTDPDLAKIMPLTGAEVSRINTATQSGWLFVCGCNGVAVLSQANGNGWLSGLQPAAGLDALSAAAFPGLYTFKKLREQNNQNAFMNVRKLVAAGGRMYVETLNGIFFFDMAAGKFDGIPTVQLGDEKVAGFDNRLIADLVVLSPDFSKNPDSNRGVVATDQGLFATNLREDTKNAQAAVMGTSGLDLQLQLVGDRRSKAPTSGNVYALATDFDNNNDKLYRFDVPTAAVKPANIADLVKIVTTVDADGNAVKTGLTQSFNNTVQSFMTDGTFDYTTLPKSYGSTNYLTLTNVDNSGSMNVTQLLDIDTTKNTYISGVLRDGASGAIMVPGDWGVRVNE